MAREDKKKGNEPDALYTTRMRSAQVFHVPAFARFEDTSSVLEKAAGLTP